ncbi:MAG: hypothetical protein ABJD07_07735 [Gemmatimonadaceae bacterium]
MTEGDRASQIWQVLIGAAHDRRTLTYAMLADRIGLAAGELARPLGMVARYCAIRQLPPLTVLVVQIDVGKPAAGFSWASDHDFAREAVFQRAWFALRPPSSGDFTLAEGMSVDEPLG